MVRPRHVGERWRGVQALEFDAGVGRVELPIDADLPFIAGMLPGGDFRDDELLGINPPVQALPAQHGQRALGQPP
jgi:hypothetical protein